MRTQEVDFSVFRLLQNWSEPLSKAPPSNKRWYVVVLGETPPEPIVRQVTEAIQISEPVGIPDASLNTEGAQAFTAMGVM